MLLSRAIGLSLILGLTLLFADSADAFHRHRAVVSHHHGYGHHGYSHYRGAYWGGGYAVRGHHHHAYRSPIYHAPRYAYGPAVRYGYHGYPRYSTYRSYYGSWPVGVYGYGYGWTDPWLCAPSWGWFGSDLTNFNAAPLVANAPAVAPPIALAGGQGAAARPLVARIPAVVSHVIGAKSGNRVLPAAAARPVRSVAESDVDARRRATKYVEQGDALFARGRYLEAMSVYQRASKTAPDMAQPLFRQGFAYIAAQRYDRAAEVIRQGTELEPEYASAGFRLQQLYGYDAPAKERHIEALAEATLNDPENAAYTHLVGVFLHFDGKAERAAPFFARAAKLAGPDADYIAAFQAGSESEPAGPVLRTAVR